MKKKLKYVQNAYLRIEKRLVKEMKFNDTNVIVVVKNSNQKYKWLKPPILNLEKENNKLLEHIRSAYKESNGIYDYIIIHYRNFIL